MTERPGRARFWMGGAAIALLAFAALLLLFFGRAPSPPPLPNPNGYDEFVKAGRTITGKLDGLADLNHDELRSLVITNADALRLVRQGLTHRCVVPTDAAMANFAATLKDLAGLKKVAKVLAAEERLAELENRLADAAQSCVDLIRLGIEMSRGGLLINRLIGIACEGMGEVPLAKLISKLTCEQIKPLAEELDQIGRTMVTWREVWHNESRFVRAQLGKYPNPIKFVPALWQDRKAAQERHDVAAVHLRLLTTELALRSFRCDRGSAPRRLQEIVPKYLQLMPSDTFSGHPLVYRPKGTNWVLYSLGPDRLDDGGKPAGHPIISGDYGIGFGINTSGKDRNRGDLFYDSPW